MMGDDKELILKIQVPHMGILKTMRTNTGYRVGQLTAAVTEKLETAERQDFSHFGLYWYNDTGPVWLADTSFIRAYGFKNGDTLQFKQKPAPPHPNANATKKNSFLSARSKTINVITPPLPSQPSSPSLHHTISPRSSPKSPVSPREDSNNGKMSAKDALMKVFQQPQDPKLSPPPPSSARPSSQYGLPSTPTFSSAAASLLQDEYMQKSASSPSPPVKGRPYAATSPPGFDIVPSFSNDNLSVASDEGISPREYPTKELSPRSAPSPPSPPPPPSVIFAPPSPPSAIFAPPSPPSAIFTAPSSPPTSITLTQPPPFTFHAASLSEDLPRIPSSLPPPSLLLPTSPSSGSIPSSSSPSLSVTRPPLSKSDDTPKTPTQVQQQSLSQVRPYASSSALITPTSLTSAQICESCLKSRTDADREKAQRVKLKQRLDLAECILSDTLQAIEEGESNVGAIKMYLITAIKTLRTEDAAKLSFNSR